MKRTNLSHFAFIPITALAITLNSCIYDTPAGDEFYRTLWETSEEPFDGLTIEFLCEGHISAQAENAAGSFGTYDFHNLTATFNGLTLRYDNTLLIIEEAHRNDDTLTISWHYSDASTTYSTRMHRLKAYK